MEEVVLNFRLTGAGWSEATFCVGNDCIELVAGYLSDALGDPIRAGLSIARGRIAATVIWDAEPYQYRWFLERTVDVIEIRIAGDDQWVGGDPGTTLLHSTCSPTVFCSAIAEAATQVLSEHGEAGYLNLWGEHRFPTEALNALRAELT